MNIMNDEHLVILLAEDDDGHASLIQRNLKRAGVANQIVRVRDGQEALDLAGTEHGQAVAEPVEETSVGGGTLPRRGAVRLQTQGSVGAVGASGVADVLDVLDVAALLDELFEGD